MQTLAMPGGTLASTHLCVDDLLSATLEQLRSALAVAQDLLKSRAPAVQPALPTIRIEDRVRSVAVGTARVELTEQQMAFFKLLLAADRPLSADDILDTLYPVGERPGKQIVAVVICNLRKKLKAACGGRDPIETVRKVGFILHQEMLPSAVDEQQTPSKADWRRPRKEVAELVH